MRNTASIVGAHRFPRERRVRSRADFQRIQRSGRRVHTASFVLLLSGQTRSGEPSHTQDCVGPARLGITASKRVGNAVVRNRAKRIVRDAFRRSGQLFEPGIDVVAIVRPSAVVLTSNQVLEEWQSAASRLRKAAQSIRDDQNRPAERNKPS